MNMNKFFNYVFYGFYQIDYVFGVRPYPYYHIRTGGVLFIMSVFLYTYSTVLLVIGWGLKSGLIECLSASFLEILTIIIGFIVVLGWNYWLNKGKYKTYFEKFDLESSSIRWACFILALFWGIGGVTCLSSSISYLHRFWSMGAIT